MSFERGKQFMADNLTLYNKSIYGERFSFYVKVKKISRMKQYNRKK